MTNNELKSFPSARSIKPTTNPTFAARQTAMNRWISASAFCRANASRSSTWYPLRKSSGNTTKSAWQDFTMSSTYVALEATSRGAGSACTTCMRIFLGCIGLLSDLQKHVRLEYRKEPLSSSYHEGFEVAGQKGAILQHFSYAATSMPDCAANDGGYYVGLRELIRI